MRLAFGVLPLVTLAAGQASAQSVVELRGSSTEYRFVDFNHTFRNGIVADLLYLGAPGANELYVGLGYAWKPARGITITPILYGVAAKENDERGIAPGALVFVDRGGFRVLGFVGRFVRLDGDVADYDFLDSLDVTRAVGKWEIGVSGGFFHTGGEWNPLVGPTVKLNDRLGSTALAVRGGYRGEVRLVRVFTF